MRRQEITDRYFNQMEQVRQKRERGLRQERLLLQETPRCFYCGEPVPQAEREWVGHRTVARSQCAWAANDEFFAALDAQKDAE